MVILLADNPRFEVLVIIILCVNIVLTLSGVLNTSDEGNIINSFFKTNGEEIQDLNQNFEDEVTQVTSSGAVTGTEFEGFTDLPTALAGIFKFIVGSLTAPFQLFLNPKLNLPLVFRWLVGLPLSLLWIFSIIGWWRQGQ